MSGLKGVIPRAIPNSRETCQVTLRLAPNWLVAILNQLTTQYRRGSFAPASAFSHSSLRMKVSLEGHQDIQSAARLLLRRLLHL